MNSLDSFGDWLRQRREALGLTRPELAGCAGCSVSGLRKIEAGERRPSRQLAELLAQCLHIALEEQPAFIEAARGLRWVGRLGQPAARSLTTSAQTHAMRSWSVGNLPSPATPLVGREAELQAIVRLLDDPGCRLLTLFGPGGIGKTRLAIEAACEVWDRFADGVFFISLAAINSAELIAPTIAQAIGLNFAGPDDPRRQLVSYLSHGQTLLLLDNCEHLLDGIDLLAEILERASGLKVLATSRERLHLHGEWGFEVPGLPLPPEGQREGLESNSAVQLFLQRARRARLDFEPSQEEWIYLVRICRLVAGIPLAIELSAAWVPVLSCREIAEELTRGLDILATTLRDVPERQRSMRAVFDHSWQLLSAEEQCALRQLSVFRGGFQREAAQAVCGADLTTLSSLVAQSFVRRSSSGRFTIHDLIAQYIAERLGQLPEEELAARDRHSAYYVEFAAAMDKELKGARQLETLAEMDAEIDNIRQAWHWAIERGRLAAIRRPMRALWYYYDIRGWFQEAEAGFGLAGRRLEQRAAAGEESSGEISILHAYACAQQGWFCLRVGRFDKAERLLHSNVELLRRAGASVELVDALQHAGALDRLMGNYARSRAYYEEMLQNALQTNDPWNAAIANGNIGLAAQAFGDYQEAERRMAGNVASFRALGDNRMLAVALHFLGGTSCTLGAYGRAGAFLHESLTLSRTLGDRWIETMTLRELGRVAQAKGEHARAISLFQDSLAVATEINEQWSTLQALNSLGSALAAVDDLSTARGAYHKALAMAWEMQALPDVLASLGGLAQLDARQATDSAGLQTALVPILFIANHPATAQSTKDVLQQVASLLEQQLAPAAVEAARVMADATCLETLVMVSSCLDASE